MRPNAFLEYKRFRYLKGSALLIAAASLGYWITLPASGAAHGGTWFGYVLGIVSAGLVLLLAWYGVRKRTTPTFAERRQGDRRQTLYSFLRETGGRRGADRRTTRAEDHWRHGGSVQGWLSAHAYLGGALVVVVSLHSGFRFAWNVHFLAYFLVLAVVASGIYGAIAYLRYPRLITENNGDEAMESLLLEFAELHRQVHSCARDLPGEVNRLVAGAHLTPHPRDRLLPMLYWRRQTTSLASAISQLQQAGRSLIEGDQPRQVRELHEALLKQQQLAVRIRKELDLTVLLRFWLYVHVPLSIALLAALLAHVAAILIYW